MDTSIRGDQESTEARARLADAVEKAKEVYQKLQEQTTAAAKATDHAVREHPYQAVGIAFGIGLLAGLLLSRSRGD